MGPRVTGSLAGAKLAQLDGLLLPWRRLVLPAKIPEVHGESAEVELHGGMRATVCLSVTPGVAAGQYVMVDRGPVLQVIEPGEVEASLAMYDVIGQMLAEADSAQDPAWVQGGERA